MIVLQETWAPDDGPAQHDEVAAALGMGVVAVPLARADLEPKPSMRQPRRPRAERRAAATGAWPSSRACRSASSRIIALPQLARRPVDAGPCSRRTIDVDGTNLTVVGTHFSHLEFGSPLHRPSLCGAACRPTDRPAVFVGDMNMWGWTIDAMTPAGLAPRRAGQDVARPSPPAPDRPPPRHAERRGRAQRGAPRRRLRPPPHPSPAARPVTGPVVFLCTGNAARSVMGGAALAAHLPDWHVTTAGTLVVEGQPMSWRTKAALDAVGLDVAAPPQPAGDGRRPGPCCAGDRPGPGARALGAPHAPRGGRPHRHPAAPGTRPARRRHAARRSGRRAAAWPRSSWRTGRRSSTPAGATPRRSRRARWRSSTWSPPWPRGWPAR